MILGKDAEYRLVIAILNNFYVSKGPLNDDHQKWRKFVVFECGKCID